MRQQLSLKPAHKVVQDFYKEIDNLSQLNLFHEGAVSPAFANLLKRCASQFGWTLSEQHMPKGGRTNLRFDGALLDEYKLVHGVWEAKDSKDALPIEAAKKFKAGYPKDNILFQSPQRAILFQNGQQVFDADIRKPEQLVGILELFFEYEPPAYEQWNEAVEEFKLRIHEYGESALAIIEQERRTNKRFVQAFNDFMEVCRTAINPNLSAQAVEEMLIQHLLTERLFRKVFNNPDFVRRNAIAAEIEKVIEALTSQSFSRAEFLKKLDRFYGAIEMTAETIDDFSEKQAFLNVVYEKFFQGFSVKVADTHGIVYTPQPIVDFMVRSVEEILKREFGRSLSDEGVHILDPFTGTGNFIVRTMREIRKSALPGKFAGELHCNEVMLLPYYIAAQNIEHAYYELTGQYQPFENLCLVDTFQLAENGQLSMSFMAAANTTRVERQKQSPIFVIIGNPPYNAKQINENDNSKNRKYEEIDQEIADTYSKDSVATLKNQLSDPYVKAFRWASGRIGEEGIIAYVSNNSFIDGSAFDGMRKHLAKDFDAIYILNLTGNVRRNPKLSGSTHNVFGIQVGVSISFLVKRKNSNANRQAKIYYARTNELWTKEQKYAFLAEHNDIENIKWDEITPDRRHNWLTEGLDDAYLEFISMGSKEAKSAKGKVERVLFKNYSNGIKSDRDSWVTNFSPDALTENTQRLIANYNTQIFTWQRQTPLSKNIDDFVIADETQISWSSGLKAKLLQGRLAEFDSKKIRPCLYRPFAKQHILFDDVLIDRPGQFPKIFPNKESESENFIICVSQSVERPFTTIMTNVFPNLVVCGGFGAMSQCFPFYVYDEDGGNRRENISDWAVQQFNEHYGVGATRPGVNGAPSSTEGEHNGKTSGPGGSPLPPGGRGVHGQGDPSAPDGMLQEQNPSASTGSDGTEWVAPTKPIGKWDIFYYVYALLHSPAYREKYAANLKRDLPHIPFVDSVETFWKYVEAGRKLTELHVNYESQPEYPLEMVENPSARLDWRVEKMKLVKPAPLAYGHPPKYDEVQSDLGGARAGGEGKSGHPPIFDASQSQMGGAEGGRLVYNNFLTLCGIPAEAFEYRLGNRSALDWVIDQYRVTVDPRSKIVNDPNDSDDPQYIVRLIKKVVTVSVETVKVVKEMLSEG